MKPREFKLNFALTDQMNVWRLRGYARNVLNPNKKPKVSRFRPALSKRAGLLSARRTASARRSRRAH